MSYRIRTGVPLAQTEDELARCFRQWGAADFEVGYNMPVKGRDAVASRGYNGYSPSERAVTVRWRRRDGTPMVLSLGTQPRPRDNLRALYLAIDSMRLNEKRGIDASVMRSAYLQLAAPAGANPYAVCGITPGATYEQAQAAFRAAAKAAHPDMGGSDAAMRDLNGAWRQVRELEGWPI